VCLISDIGTTRISIGEIERDREDSSVQSCSLLSFLHFTILSLSINKGKMLFFEI
jgi:hypothetical protein